MVGREVEMAEGAGIRVEAETAEVVVGIAVVVEAAESEPTVGAEDGHCVRFRICCQLASERAGSHVW